MLSGGEGNDGFRGIQIVDVVKLFKSAEDQVRYQAGQAIFHQGEPAHHMYVVLDGEVDILAGERLVETARAGSLLGEMALVGDHVRSATAVARTDCVLAAVTERRFTFLVQETPFFALHVMRVMADRIRRLDRA